MHPQASASVTRPAVDSSSDAVTLCLQPFESSERYARFSSLADAAHAQDPTPASDGTSRRHAQVYHARVLHWSRRLCAQEPAQRPSEALLLASQTQHILRFTRPRDTFPAGRAGYLRWRREMYTFHAEHAAGLMRQAGYTHDADDELVGRVKELVSKQGLSAAINKDAKETGEGAAAASDEDELRLLEDAVCVTFLELEYDAFVRKMLDSSDTSAEEEDKLVQVVRRTWRKMGPRGRHAAGQLLASSSPHEGADDSRSRDILMKALAEPDA